MSEEALQEEVVVEEEAIVEEVTYTAAEQQAMKHGWKPQENWEGSKDDFITAPEFNRRAELFDKIARQSKEIKEVKDQFTKLAAHQSKVAEKAKQEVLEALKEEKIKAYADEDFEKVVEIDEKIAVERNTEIPEVNKQPDPAFDEWAARNEWYSNDTELTELADALGIAYGNAQVKKGRSADSITMDEVLTYVDSKMKKHISTNAQERAPSAVESATKSPSKRSTKSSKPKFTAKDLNNDQLELMRGIIKADPLMTEAAYIEELVKIGELK